MRRLCGPGSRSIGSAISMPQQTCQMQMLRVLIGPEVGQHDAAPCSASTEAATSRMTVRRSASSGSASGSSNDDTCTFGTTTMCALLQNGRVWWRQNAIVLVDDIASRAAAVEHVLAVEVAHGADHDPIVAEDCASQIARSGGVHATGSASVTRWPARDQNGSSGASSGLRVPTVVSLGGRGGRWHRVPSGQHRRTRTASPVARLSARRSNAKRGWVGRRAGAHAARRQAHFTRRNHQPSHTSRVAMDRRGVPG